MKAIKYLISSLLFHAAHQRGKSPKSSSLLLAWQLSELSVPCQSILKSGDEQGSVFKGRWSVPSLDFIIYAPPNHWSQISRSPLGNIICVCFWTRCSINLYNDFFAKSPLNLSSSSTRVFSLFFSSWLYCPEDGSPNSTCYCGEQQWHHS